MNRQRFTLWSGVIVLTAAVFSSGCNSDNGASAPSGLGSVDNKPMQPFTLAWSEYPSWSVFGVAHENGLIHKDEGEKGTLEEKWGVDIVLKQMDYDTCLSTFSNGTADAVCITNMDVLAPALGRNSVAIMPTSTSDGADACIVTGVASVEELKGVESFGLEKSVSQYTFERCLEERNLNPADYKFRQMDPGAAAVAMQQSQEGIKSIVVWNPFVLQTLRARGNDAKVLFDSTEIPEEIIDMVVVGQDSLNKKGGDKFASCVVDAFYEVNKLLEGADTGEKTLMALGENFAKLSLEDMKTIVKQTKFYKTPADGKALFEKESFRTTIMPRVVDFCVSHQIVEEKPTVGFGEKGQLRFTTKYMDDVASGGSGDEITIDIPEE